MKENTQDSEPTVYLLQEVPGTKIGRPKYNIIGAQKYGKIKVLLREDTQIVRSPGPITYQLRRLLKDFSAYASLMVELHQDGYTSKTRESRLFVGNRAIRFVRLGVNHYLVVLYFPASACQSHPMYR